jgi:MFS family permease
MDSTTNSNYRWYMLALATLTVIFVATTPIIAMSVLFVQISTDLQLSIVQIGTVWGMLSLAAAFMMPAGGILGDRLGIKRVVIFSCCVGGIIIALIGVSTNFITLMVTAFLAGLMVAAVPVHMHKITGFWFKGKQLGMANGVIATGMGIGFTLGAILSGTVLVPLLHGWRNVFFLYGSICVVIGILWAFIAQGDGITRMVSSDGASFRQVVGKILRIRNLWFMGLGQFGFGGCLVGVTGYLPTYFKGIGWTPIAADATLATLNIVSTVATIPLAAFSDRLKSRKTLLLIALVVTTISVSLLSMADNAAVWPLVIGVGIFRDGFMAIMITMIIEMSGVGVAYSGTAIGLVSGFQRLGGFFSAPVGNSLAEIRPNYSFFLWAGLSLFALIMFSFVREEKGVKEVETVR